MGISDNAINSLPLGKDVEQVITDAFQDWQGAIEYAIDHLSEPPGDTLTLEWGVSLIGNMLWACTVFFPPTFAIASVAKVAGSGVLSAGATVFASATAATKAASVLGAAIGSSGSQIAGILRYFDGDLSSPDAKKFVHDFFLTQQGEITSQYVQEADKWASKDLLNHIIAQGSIRHHWNPKEDNDASFTQWYNSAVASQILRTYVWEQYLFPGGRIYFARGKLGLEKFFEKIVEKMREDFASQYKKYRKTLSRGSRGTGGGSYSDPPFEPIFRFDGIPEKISSLYHTNASKISHTLL